MGIREALDTELENTDGMIEIFSKLEDKNQFEIMMGILWSTLFDKIKDAHLVSPLKLVMFDAMFAEYVKGPTATGFMLGTRVSETLYDYRAKMGKIREELKDEEVVDIEKKAKEIVNEKGEV